MTLYREKTDTKGTGPLTLRGRAPGAVSWSVSGLEGQVVRYSLTEGENVEIGTGLARG